MKQLKQLKQNRFVEKFANLSDCDRILAEVTLLICDVRHILALNYNKRPLYERYYTLKNYQSVIPATHRHSRESGNPSKWLIKIDSRFRGNDGWVGFLGLKVARFESFIGLKVQEAIKLLLTVKLSNAKLLNTRHSRERGNDGWWVESSK